MPLAVALGGDPAVVVAAAAGWSPQLDTFALAGLFCQRPLDVVACRSVELAVPAETEIVLEGYVDPARAAGPDRAAGHAAGTVRPLRNRRR